MFHGLLLLGFSFLLGFGALGMRSPALGTFLGFTDDDVIAFGSGQRAPNEQQIISFMDLDDFQVLHGATDLPQVPGHLHATHDGAGKETLPNGTRAPMPAFGAVGRVAAAESVARDYALEAAPFGHADGVNVVTGSKQRRANHIPRLHFLGEVSEFLDALDRYAIEFLDMAKQRFCEAVFFLVVKSELDGAVAITLFSLALQNAIGTGQNDGDRADEALGVIDARVAEGFS